VNAVRCVPPQNRPTPAEVATCRRFLAPHLLAAADDADPAAGGPGARPRRARERGPAYGLKPGRHPFTHGGEHPLPGERTLVSSYHTSRYNVNTGVLTPEMFDEVVARAAALLRGPPSSPGPAGAF
jgi:uracil-DNA glycosylase